MKLDFPVALVQYTGSNFATRHSIMKKTTEKLFLYLIPLLFTFPLFKENVSSFFFVLLATNTVAYNIITKNYKSINWKRVLLLSIPLWIIIIASSLKTTLITDLKDVNHALFFLLVPLVFGLIPNNYFSRQKIELYISILKNACFMICIVYLAAFFYYHPASEFFEVAYNVSAFRNFVYSEIGFFNMHPTYFSAIMLFCISFSAEKVIRERKLYELFYIVFFTIMTLLLLVKINILSLIILFPVIILFRSGMTVKMKLIAIPAIIAFMAAIVWFGPGLKNRFSELYESIDRPPVGLAHDSTNIRVAILKCSLEIAKENYMFGIGFEQLPYALHNCFVSHYDSEFYKTHKYLTHNYYAYLFLSSGIFALLAFLFYLFKIWEILRKIHFFPLYVTVANVLLICFTEDYFYRQFGLLYFNLILMTFLKYYEFQKATPTKIAD